jgi:Transmembrane amino acid transporter protein
MTKSSMLVVMTLAVVGLLVAFILPTATCFSTSRRIVAPIRRQSHNTAALTFTPTKSAPWRDINDEGFGRMTLFLSSDAVATTADDGDDDSNTGDAAASSDSKSRSTSDGEGATVTQLCFNLVKGIVGAGVLSLPAGIAAFANAPSAVVPAVALIAVIGGLSGYGFALIGRCCAYTQTSSYRDAWSATVSQKSSWIPATAVTLKTIAATLAYSMILGDTFLSLLGTAGFACSKVPVTLGLTGAVLLPLCLMKNLSSLAPFSLVGSLGMLYTAVAMMIRYFGKAYVSSGKFGKDLSTNLRPSFGTVGAEGILSPSAAILVGMLSTAYMVRFRIWPCCVCVCVCVGWLILKPST